MPRVLCRPAKRKDHAIHPAALQTGCNSHLLGYLFIRKVDENMIALFPRNRFDSLNGQREKVIGNFRYDDGNSPAPVFAKTAGVRIGLKIHLPRQIEDTLL